MVRLNCSSTFDETNDWVVINKQKMFWSSASILRTPSYGMDVASAYMMFVVLKFRMFLIQHHSKINQGLCKKKLI